MREVPVSEKLAGRILIQIEGEMDFFDIIRELRKGEPTPAKVARGMKILGFICLGGALWNFIFPYLVPMSDFPLKFPKEYSYLALAGLTLCGALFLLSARMIKEHNPAGKRVGQWAIVLIIAVILSFFTFFFSTDFFPREFGLPEIIIELIFVIAFFGQFLVPAYFGIRYIGRLNLQNGRFGRMASPFQESGERLNLERNRRGAMGKEVYKDALFPFGILGTFVMVLAVLIASLFAISKLLEGSEEFFLIGPGILMTMALFFFYNFVPSPFERQRTVRYTSTGGGSIFLFSGTWPFFRLLLYSDGLEVRVMFHRFFIPYDKMEDIPEKIGFFSRGIFIKSDLPGVPSGIRYQGFGLKKLAARLNEYRNTYLGKGRDQAEESKVNTV